MNRVFEKPASPSAFNWPPLPALHHHPLLGSAAAPQSFAVIPSSSTRQGSMNSSVKHQLTQIPQKGDGEQAERWAHSLAGEVASKKMALETTS